MEFNLKIVDSDNDFVGWLNSQTSEEINQILYYKFMSSKGKKVVGSAEKGKSAEVDIHRLLSQNYDVTYTGNSAKRGDMIVTHNGKRIMVEVKDYASTVRSTEVAKFDRDINLNINIIHGAMFISLGSPICKQSTVEFELKPIPRLLLAMPSADMILSMMKFLISVTSDIIPANTLNEIAQLSSSISNISDIAIKLRKNNDKQLTDIISGLQTYQGKIKTLIENAIDLSDNSDEDEDEDEEIVNFMMTTFSSSLKNIIYNTMQNSYYAKDSINRQIVDDVIDLIQFSSAASIGKNSIHENPYRIRFLKNKTMVDFIELDDIVLKRDKVNVSKLADGILTCPISYNTFAFIQQTIIAIQSAHV
jgi:hypothetical protein